MPTVQRGFWDYALNWERVFPQEKRLAWEKTWLENDYCKDCRFCCGPQDSDVPFPMPLLASQSEKGANDRFYLLDDKIAYLARPGCKSDSPSGCKLRICDKPLACGFFPIVFANGGLYLYQNCPAVIFTPLIRFMEFAKKIAQILIQYNIEELYHLSICLTLEKLASSYIDLHITLIKDGQKEISYS